MLHSHYMKCVRWVVANNIRLIRTFIIMKNKRLIGIIVTVVLLLLMPLIAMQFANEINWTLFNFVVAGALLLGTGLMCELVIRKINKIKCRISICVALLVVVLLIWAELAVDILNTTQQKLDSKLKNKTLPATKSIIFILTVKHNKKGTKYIVPFLFLWQ